MQALFTGLEHVNEVIWNDFVLYIVLGVGLLFTVWTRFGQARAVTHGFQVIRGKYDDDKDPGAINHFQALSAALSATVGLGNIGGVAVAIALGGPGAVFWMWVIGIAGMALKTSEVTLSMLYRNTDDPRNPHGGPMYVAARGFAERNLPGLGKAVGGIFCVTLLISTLTGGNMFQAWNVAEVTHAYFGVHQLVSGAILAVLVGAVILGGIERIGSVAGRLVPGMCLIYLAAAFVVLIANAAAIPAALGLILSSAFSPVEAQGAFLGGTAGYAFLWGMKRALFSSEAGQGSSPIAHAAARTNEPVREAVVAGLEPFIDTLIVCTITALVILTSGIWKRGPDVELKSPIAVVETDGGYLLESAPFHHEALVPGERVYTIVSGVDNPTTQGKERVTGTVVKDGEAFNVRWNPVAASTASTNQPPTTSQGLFLSFPGATLTAKAFDKTFPGLGKWLISLAAWLFALSTMISWSYYGEQGIVFLFGERFVTLYRAIYCFLILVACMPWLIKTDSELDTFTALGTGVMLWANIPIMVIFAREAMQAYDIYMKRLDEGDFES